METYIAIAVAIIVAVCFYRVGKGLGLFGRRNKGD